MAQLKDLLVTGPTRFIGNVQANGYIPGPKMAICSTASDVAAKVANLDGFDLIVNAVINIYFQNSTGPINNATLNVNDTGAKPIYIFTNGVCAQHSTSLYIPAGQYSAWYNGTNWYITVADINTYTNHAKATLYNEMVGSGNVNDILVVKYNTTTQRNEVTTRPLIIQTNIAVTANDVSQYKSKITVNNELLYDIPNNICWKYVQSSNTWTNVGQASTTLNNNTLYYDKINKKVYYYDNLTAIQL